MYSSPLTESGLSVRIFLFAESNIRHVGSRIVDVCFEIGFIVWG